MVGSFSGGVLRSSRAALREIPISSKCSKISALFLFVHDIARKETKLGRKTIQVNSVGKKKGTQQQKTGNFSHNVRKYCADPSPMYKEDKMANTTQRKRDVKKNNSTSLLLCCRTSKKKKTTTKRTFSNCTNQHFLEEKTTYK